MRAGASQPPPWAISGRASRRTAAGWRTPQDETGTDEACVRPVAVTMVDLCWEMVLTASVAAAGYAAAR